MNKIFINILLFFSFLLIISFAYDKGIPVQGRIKLQFITYNGFGNNLYIDNLIVGQRPVFDIGISGIYKIPNDTFYSAVQDTVYVIPEASVTNFGQTNISQIQIKMEINNLLYSSSKDTSINSGMSIIIAFDSLKIPSGIPLDIKVYSSIADSNSFNDTLSQNSIMLSGAPRTVLLEEFTSNTSGSCGTNNTFLDNFINEHFDKLCAVKYHMGYPPPGNDSMYLQNPAQADERKNYYNINAVPASILDGIEYLLLPYYPDTNIAVSLNRRIESGSPLSVAVQDTRVSGDSIRTMIDINILHNLKSGNYRLRIFTVERHIYDSIPPGTNGETDFYDVFRYSITDSAGIQIPLLTGNYQYSFTYLKQSAWVDSMIYTVAFIQNDNSKEVLNCGKARNYPLNYFNKQSFKNKYSWKPDKLYTFFNYNSKLINSNLFLDTVPVNFKTEIFEYFFPPNGWNLSNNDLSYTFANAQGINGPSIGGNKCIKLPFYDYGNKGQRDSLMSGIFVNISASDTLQFDYAYAQYLTGYNDSLIVRISTDDGITFSTIFAKSGTELSTAPATTLPFTPSSASEWKTFKYPLSQIFNPYNFKPDSYRLYQNYPNPFNPKTTITYQLPKSVFVTLKIYDITGRELKTLVNEIQNQGIYDLNFDGASLASGIYFFVLKTNDFRDAKKMVLIK